MARLGVLALQGDYAAHAAHLAEIGHEAVEVRRCGQLDLLDGLILPGGESTALLRLMAHEPWFDDLREFHAQGGVLFGTCAGAILLSRHAIAPEQPSLGLLDATIQRNGFGRQIDSFETELEMIGFCSTLEAVFIRAPRFVELGAEVEVLARLGDEPVLVRQGRVLAATFHPELTTDSRLHGLFANLTEEQSVKRRESARRVDRNIGERRVSC